MTACPESNLLVSFWGTRGSISTPGRTTEKYGGNTPCVAVQYHDVYLIFDAGTGIRNLGIELLDKYKSRGNSLSLHLFLSHTHWDHIQGFPFFQPAYVKDASLTIYGSHRKEHFLASVLKKQMDYDYFPIGMSSFSADIKIKELSESVIQVGKAIIDWQEQVNHPGGSVRYRLCVDGKKIVYATDVELNQVFEPANNCEEYSHHARDYLDFIKDADLLIADGQYTEEEYMSKVGWGHTSIPLIIDIASQAHVKQLAIFHHDPQHSDKLLDSLWAKNTSASNVTRNKANIFWAREGMTLAV